MISGESCVTCLQQLCFCDLLELQHFCPVEFHRFFHPTVASDWQKSRHMTPLSLAATPRAGAAADLLPNHGIVGWNSQQVPDTIRCLTKNHSRESWVQTWYVRNLELKTSRTDHIGSPSSIIFPSFTWLGLLKDLLNWSTCISMSHFQNAHA